MERLEEAAREYNEMIEAGEDPDVAAYCIDASLGIAPPPPREHYEEQYDES
jgi:hypothetical protein